MSTKHALLEHLFGRLAEQGTSDRTAEVVLGAYAGEEQLRAVLAGDPADFVTAHHLRVSDCCLRSRLLRRTISHG